MWIIKLLQKKLSDKTIRIWKVVFGLIFTRALFYNLIYQWDKIENNIMRMNISDETLIYIKYFIISLGIIPVISWTFDLCLFKWKYVRIFQIFSGIALFYISSLIVDSPTLEVDTLIWLMWIFPIIWWITWKLITEKWSSFWYKVTKIRV